MRKFRRPKWKSACFFTLFFSFFCIGAKCEIASSNPSGAAASNRPSKQPAVQPLNHGPQAYPNEETTRLPVFTMDYPRVQVPLEFTLWVLLASFAKIGFHIYHKITIWIPESCLLIVIGLIVGGIMHAVKEEPPALLDSNVFFLYMLPPIVLENGYFMPTRPFFQNVGTVIWYAVVGTLWNSIGIGLSLYAICQIEVFGVQDITLQENLLFASIISAVDPVAVLNVFEDIGVNEQLYIIIFGEGLFNDAVTVVLYNMFIFMADMPSVESSDVFLGVARFFVVGVGGVLFGFLFGFGAAFTTRFTSNVREIEPLFVFMYSYLAYLVSELFTISSIMAIVICAVTMKFYVEENVAQRSCTTIRHVIKMLATISETLIFFFLGVVTIMTDHEWNWAYILFTLLFAFVWRGLGILVLSQIVNPFRTIPFNYKDQFGLSYGGLRGAICFALAFTLPDTINRRELFVTASIAVIIFTVFIQGISIRPLIEYINIRRTNKDLNTINVEVHTRVMEHVIAGVEDLCGQWSHYYWKDKFKKFNDLVLRRILLSDSRAESSIVALYKKLELQSAIDMLDSHMGDISAAPSIVALNVKKPSTKPKRKFLAADVRRMHDILAKNMYKIRQMTVGSTNKHALPDNTQTREILIRRYPSIRRSLRASSVRNPALSKSQKYYSLQPDRSLEEAFPLRSHNHGGADEVDHHSAQPWPRALGPSPHSSARSLVPPHKLDTLNELVSQGPGGRPGSPPRQEPPSPGVDYVDEGAASGSSLGGPRGQSLRGRKPPVPTPRRRSSERDERERDPQEPRGGGGGEGRGVVRPPPLPPPSGWLAENQDPRVDRAGNPLLRQSSRRSRSSHRP